VICPSCSAENKPGAKFCNECGTPLALRCPRCGAEHRQNQKFCDECGLALATAPPAGNAGGAGQAAAPPVPAEPESAELRLVSVLFVDLVGFTALSETREAEDVRELLGRYFDSARTIVERYGGTIEKFIGDAVMAVWGVPVAREDDAERAVRAALDVVDAVALFGVEVGAPDLRARAGVVTGQVAALINPGEGLVVGDRVNTASRVQSAAAPGSVFVDEVTRQVTSASIAYEDAGEHAVKGKAEPLRLWRAMRVVAGVAGNQREQGLEAPFVGRDADLRLLKELFHQALERRSARLVAVSGEAGVGKTRLLREFSNYTDGIAEQILWHAGRCLSYGEGVAYWALVEMVRQRLGIPEDAPLAEADEKLTAGLARWVPDESDREFLRPRLGALLGLSEPGLGREELFAGWRMFFERLAAHEPVVLVFEDMQWADQGLLDFISQLLDWSAQSPIFILTLARPELAARHQGWPAGLRGATLLALEPLEDRAMRELLDAVVDDLPEAAAERIVSQAEGVPLYAVETLRALVDRGALVERDGRLVLESELGELDVPASLGSLLAARIDALDPVERQLVKAMSVFGGSFPRASAAALSGVADEQLEDVLATLVRKQVLAIRADRLSPDRGQYAFAQGLLRTVAYEMLSRQERKARHLAAADHLRQIFPNDGEEVAEAIASHYVEAYRAAGEDADAEELRAQTVTALRRAAQRASAVGAPEGGERSLRIALEMTADPSERVELMRATGQMALAAGRNEVALELFTDAREAAREAGDERTAALIGGPLGTALTRLGRNEEATEQVQAALDALHDTTHDSDVGRLHFVLGRSRAALGQFEQAVLPLERALGIAEALQLPDLLSQALTGKAVMYVNTARVEEARLLLAGAADIARRDSRTVDLSRAIGNLGNLEMEWDLPEAFDHLETARQLSVRHGDRYMTNIQTGNLMVVHLFAGRWTEVERLADELLAGNDGIAAGGMEDLYVRLAMLHALRGEVDAARESLAQLASWEHSDEREARALHGVALLSVHVAEGDWQAAFEHGREVLSFTLESLAASNETVRWLWPVTMEAALGVGRLDVVRDLISLLSERPPGHIPPFLNVQLVRSRALLAAAEGRHDDVETDMNAVVERLRDLGYRYWLAGAQTDLAQWLIEQGRGSEAEPLLTDAMETLRGLGAAPALRRSEEVARSLPAVEALP